MTQESPEQTMVETMSETLTEEEVVEAICHCERTGSLESGHDEWVRYDSLAALPDRPLGGWEELVVFTDEHVYRQTGVGYDGGVTVTPRTPSAIVEEASPSASAVARADDD